MDKDDVMGKDLEEDYPGQTREYQRQIIREAAWRAADDILMKHADGDPDEQFIITAEFVIEATKHMTGMMAMRSQRIEFENRMRREDGR